MLLFPKIKGVEWGWKIDYMKKRCEMVVVYYRAVFYGTEILGSEMFPNNERGIKEAQKFIYKEAKELIKDKEEIKAMRGY